MDFLGSNSFETIEATQQRLDEAVFTLNQERNTLQRSEATVREKRIQVIHKQQALLKSTDRSSERQQQTIDLQSQKQRLTTAERAIQSKLDTLQETETTLLHAFRNLEDRIVLDKAMKSNRLQEQQQQKEAQARSEMITKLIEDQSRAVRRLRQEEAEQKSQRQKETTKESAKETRTEKKQKKFENGDDACSICLIPVSYYYLW